MPRIARKLSSTGIYHVMLRGNRRQVLFEDDDDRERFLETIQRFSDELKTIVIHTYCLMDNHVHLLIEDKTENSRNLAIFMQKVELSYAYYYNVKYEGCGSVFDGRYKSEPIENEKYFLTAFKYIIRNPEKAGICKHDEYPWNSYKEIFTKRKKITMYSCPDFAVELFNGTRSMKEFLATPSDSEYEFEYREPSTGRITDKIAKNVVDELLRAARVTSLKDCGRKKRDAILRNLKDRWLSIRQIAFLTGISRGIVLKA